MLDALESLDPAITGIIIIATGLALAVTAAVIIVDRHARRVRLSR